MQNVNKTQERKKEGGITLIALVITIIVLFILAGVALSSLFGDNGIINNAESAKLQTNHTSVAEGLKLKMSEYQIAKSVEGYSNDYKTFLKEYEGGAILDDDGVINVKNLLGKKLSTGNGTGSNDVYKLEEVTETAKLASIQEVKIAETTNSSKKYVLKYYKGEGNFVELEIFGGTTTSNSENAGTEVNIDDILADALVNPDKYVHEDQKDTNTDIGIDEDGNLVNMDLWTYTKIDTTSIGLYFDNGCGGATPGYANSNINIDC